MVVRRDYVGVALNDGGPCDGGDVLVTVELGFDIPGIDPYPDRIALEAITVCCVCGKPIEPESEAEFEASESLGVHVGECFRVMKRHAARIDARDMRTLPPARGALG
jgi:hypothetical protein